MFEVLQLFLVLTEQCVNLVFIFQHIAFRYHWFESFLKCLFMYKVTELSSYIKKLVVESKLLTEVIVFG